MLTFGYTLLSNHLNDLDLKNYVASEQRREEAGAGAAHFVFTSEIIMQCIERLPSQTLVVDPGSGHTPVGRTPAGRTPAGRTPAGRTPAGQDPGDQNLLKKVVRKVSLIKYS